MTRLFGDLERFGERLALIDETGREVSYAELIELGRRYVEPLGPARRLVFIEMENKLAPIAAYVGAMRAGHAAVLTGEGGGGRHSRLSRTFGPEAVFLNGWNGWGFELRRAEPAGGHDDLAVLLSTSGSTGSPKLVRLSHGALIANAQSIVDYLGFEEGERAITSLPPAYSYGMSVINSHLVAGQALILTDASVTEEAFWDLFHTHGATSFAGVPHTYELLEHTGFLASDHPSLRYFTQAGGKLAADKVRRFAEWATARAHRFFVMYGQTEAGPRMAYVPPKALAEHPDVIGVAVPGGTLSVEDGELIYRGPNVMMGYAVDREDLALGQQLTELRTGDLANVDANGFFRITGRASRFSKIFGLRISLDEVEAMLAEAGAEGAVAGDDEGLSVAVAGKAPADLRQTLAERLHLPAVRITLTEVAELPRKDTGKIDYPAILALRGGSAAPIAPPPAAKTTKPAPAPAALAAGQDGEGLRKAFAELLGVASIKDTDTFIGLGGDSLTYVQASLLLDTRLGAAPDGWEAIPFGQLAARGQTGAPARAPVANAGELRRKMAELLGVSVLRDQDTFVGLGGDSLSYVQASLLLETHLGAAPEGWERMTFAALAPEGSDDAPADDAAVALRASVITRLETSVFVRATAILLVVAHHVAYVNIAGGATCLLIVAGMNFARFQLPKLNNGGSGDILGSTLLRTALPYFAIVTLYCVAVGHFFWPQYLLYSGFTDGFVWQGVRRFKTYWFMETYISLMLLLCALFLLPQVRRFSMQHPKWLAMGAFALTTASTAIAKPLAHMPLFHPHTIISGAWVFMFGWMVEQMKSLKERIALAIIGAATVIWLPTDEEYAAVPVVAVGGFLLLFVRKIPVGSTLARPISLIAAASFYIYILHTFTPHVVEKIIGQDHGAVGWGRYPLAIVSILVALCGWAAVDFALSRRGRAIAATIAAPLVGRRLAEALRGGRDLAPRTAQG